jgi:hypothetical protein
LSIDVENILLATIRFWDAENRVLASMNGIESFETQRRYYTDLIESHPEWEMVKIYADRHSATKAENRPGFQEMAAVAQEPFDQRERSSLLMRTALRGASTISATIVFWGMTVKTAC